jgi:hypothetical protein
MLWTKHPVPGRSILRIDTDDGRRCLSFDGHIRLSVFLAAVAEGMPR